MVTAAELLDVPHSCCYFAATLLLLFLDVIEILVTQYVLPRDVYCSVYIFRQQNHAIQQNLMLQNGRV